MPYDQDWEDFEYESCTQIKATRPEHNCPQCVSYSLEERVAVLETIVAELKKRNNK